MIFTYGHNPKEVPLEFLQKLDAEEPGRWYGSFKWNGFRRFCVRTDGRWIWKAKPAGAGALRPLPPDLQAQFEAMPWNDDVIFDMEWVGPSIRKEYKRDELHVIDYHCATTPKTTFAHRQDILRGWMLTHNPFSPVKRVLNWQNPGLVDLFTQTLTMPHIEGIVVRRFDQVNQGSPSQCVEHPLIYKIRKKPVQQERTR